MRIRFREFARWHVGRSLVAVPAILVPAMLAILIVGCAALGTPQIALASDEETVGSQEERRANAVGRWRDATPRERHEMRENARQRWEDASPRDRRIFRRGMHALGRALPEFSPIERRVLLHKVFALSKADRASLRRRLRGVDDLDPEERERFVEELRNMLDETPGETARIERNIGRWRGMSESEREEYRDQMRRFRAMSVEDRERLLSEWGDPETE